MGIQGRKPTNTHQHLQIHRADYKDNQWPTTMDASRHTRQYTRPKKRPTTILPRPQTKNRRQLRRPNHSGQSHNEIRYRRQQRDILQHVSDLRQHQYQKQTKNIGQKTPHHTRVSWKTKTKNRPMGLHGNIQTANRWIPTVLEHQRSRRNHTIQIEKKTSINMPPTRPKQQRPTNPHPNNHRMERPNRRSNQRMDHHISLRRRLQ